MADGKREGPDGPSLCPLGDDHVFVVHSPDRKVTVIEHYDLAIGKAILTLEEVADEKDL